jgi:hypothetical protein
LHKMAVTIAFDNWDETLDAESRDYVGRLGWATAITVFVPLWLVAVATCVAVLKRESAGWLLLGLIPIYWVAERLSLSFESFRPVLPKIGYAAIAIGMLIVISLAALNYATETRRHKLWTTAIFLVGVGVGFWILNGWQLYQWPGLEAASEISNRQLAIVAPPFDELLVRLENMCNTTGKMTCGRGIYSLDRLVGGLATLALGFLGLAAAVLIAEATRIESKHSQLPDTSPIRLLSRQRKEFQRLLYAAASLLVISVTVAKSLQQWPLSVIHDRDRAKELQLIADQWLVMLGTYWTLMLAAIFIPVAVALNWRSTILSKQQTKPTVDASDGTWLEKQGSKTTTYEQCLIVLALLGPWLAGGPLASFANWMKGGGG